MRLGHRVPWRSLWTRRMADRSSRVADSFGLTHLWWLFWKGGPPLVATAAERWCRV